MEHEVNTIKERQQFFALLNHFFDKIFIITLHRATDRQKHIENELAGLNYSFFYGKDKQEFDLDELERAGIYNEALAKKNHRFGKPMPKGAVGCSWSHKLVYEHIVTNGYQKVLVLEDDVVLDEKKMARFRHILEEIPQDWELLYFGFALNEKPPPHALFKKLYYHFLSAIGVLKYSHKKIRNLYPKKITQHIYKAGYHDCTHAYALTQSAARKLKVLQEPVSFIADNLLAYAATNEIVKAYIILPKIIYQQYHISGHSAYSYVNH